MKTEPPGYYDLEEINCCKTCQHLAEGLTCQRYPHASISELGICSDYDRALYTPLIVEEPKKPSLQIQALLNCGFIKESAFVYANNQGVSATPLADRGHDFTLIDFGYNVIIRNNHGQAQAWVLSGEAHSRQADYIKYAVHVANEYNYLLWAAEEPKVEARPCRSCKLPQAATDFCPICPAWHQWKKQQDKH